jgi:hypothetical protein
MDTQVEAVRPLASVLESPLVSRDQGVVYCPGTTVPHPKWFYSRRLTCAGEAFTFSNEYVLLLEHYALPTVFADAA